MYAIVNIAGIQTKVTPDEVLDVALLTGEPGASLQFDQVLLLGDGDKISVGRPNVKGASVSAEIVQHFRGEKVKIFKFKRRREYRRRRGYRSELTRIRVTAISG
ncbi:MAG TPA: 50S ribosomal protein L21 [Candidatus Eisenbacteria bacterium]|jgi:large subunit ribosomal protein L21